MKKNLGIWRRALLLGAAISLVFAGASFAQAPTGNLHGTVADTDGESLPGTTCVLRGMGADRVQLTDTKGTFRYLGLDPGTYGVRCELDGFSTVEYPGVEIRVNRNTTLQLTLTPAVEEVITVTSESPLLDERKLQQGTSVTQVELEKIPTARDPWSLLSQTPGVLVDRINVGGSESGQQAIFRAQGTTWNENDFMVDGVQITDMSATGASPTYYDFDQFAEMQFTTGGTDVTKNSSGLEVNLVTKRGTNEFRGSARFFNTQGNGYFGGLMKQSQPNIQGELFRENGQTELAGASIRKIEDLGVEAGGAAKQDVIWLWGSWGQNDIKANAASGTADDTILENTSVKMNIQISTQNSFVASWNNGDKLKFGRGASTTRPPETTWNQRGPSAFFRFEDTHVFSSSFFLTGSYSITDMGFSLTAIGPPGVGGTNPAAPDPQNIDGVWRDNFQSGLSSRPGDEFKADASYFFNTGNTNHELKFGGRMRSVDTNSDFAWGPRDVFHADWGESVAHRGATGETTAEYNSLWVQDTITFGKATVNAGLRYDDQSGTNAQFTRAANEAFPNIFPEVTFPGSSGGFTFESVMPRIGLTYALGADRDTLLRASFSQFAQAMGTSLITRNSPFGDVYAYIDSETGDLVGTSGFDIDDPLKVVDRNDPGLDPEVTTEILLGVEHAVLPEFVVGFNITLRNVDDILEYQTLVTDAAGAERVAGLADWEVAGVRTGQLPRNSGSYSTPYFDLRDGLSYTGGTFLTNGGREREYQGANINFTKRLANRWMARGYFNWGETDWKVPQGFFSCIAAGVPGGPNNMRGGGCRDNDLFLDRSSGSGKGERFLQSSWSFSLNGMYQIAPDRPWGFNFSGAINGREGYPVPYYERLSLGTGNAFVNLVNEFDSIRLDDAITADVRVEKEFGLTQAVNLTFGIDCFNIANEGTGLSYNTRVGVSNAGNLADNISPRIYRLSLRLAWK